MLQSATANTTGDLTSLLSTVSTFDFIRFWLMTTWVVSICVRPNRETIARHATIKKLILFVIQLPVFIDIHGNLYVKMRMTSHKHRF